LALLGDAVPEREKSALQSNISHRVPRGVQRWSPRPDADKPVGEPALHSSATKQVTGEAGKCDERATLFYLATNSAFGFV
jgi:hypothetical protein